MVFGVDLQSALEARQKLEAQQTENRAVQREFSLLQQQQQQQTRNQKHDEDGTVKAGVEVDSGAGEVFRLIGPVLVKQDLDEARGIVEGRLEFIGKEMGRVEERVGSLQGEIGRLQGGR